MSYFGVLKLVDLALTGSLIVIVIFSGYENFVSKIDVRDHPDWPEWMAKIDFSGLKLKLLSFNRCDFWHSALEKFYGYQRAERS